MVRSRVYGGRALRMAFGITMLVLLLAGGASALSNSGGGSWPYYKDITITNPGGGLSDYQVLVRLTGSDFPVNAKADGADVRFTDAGGAELPYWIESWGAGSAKVWVKVPSIPESASIIRMYYGNPSAISSSNGDATFELFDDFNSTTIDTNKWNIMTPSRVSSGVLFDNKYSLRLDVSELSNTEVGLNSKNLFPQSRSFHAKVRDEYSDDGGFTWSHSRDFFGFNDYIYGQNWNMATAAYTFGDSWKGLNYNGTAYSVCTLRSPRLRFNWIDVIATRYYDKSRFYLIEPSGAADNCNTSDQIPNKNLPVFLSSLHSYSYINKILYVDYVYVTKFNDPEPSVSVGGAGPYAYITNSGSNTVSVIDTATNTITATVNVGANPFGIAVNPAGTKVYVANYNSNTVSVIDTATNNVIATVNVGPNPFGIAVNPAGTKVYVTIRHTNAVSVIDTASNSVTATVYGFISPTGVAINPAGTKVYVTNGLGGSVSVIDTATNTITATVNVGTNPQGIAINPAGTKVYVPNFISNTVSVIDTATYTVTATVNVGTNPNGVAVNPTGTKVYVTNQNSNTVSVIDTATNDVTATVNVGSYPFGIAVNPAGTKVYVANTYSNTVSVIDTATNNVIDTVNVGNGPAAFGQFIEPEENTVPIAEYHFDGDAKDSSGNGNDGIIYGGAAFVNGISGQALNFDGVDDHVTVPYSTSFNLADMTLETWVYIDSATNAAQSAVISRDNCWAGGTRKLFDLKPSHGPPGYENKPAFNVLIGDTLNWAVSPEALTTGWHHLAGVRSAGNYLKLYIDGIEKASVPNTFADVIDSKIDLTIGAITKTSCSGQNFNGIIDEVRIYNRTLSADEIKAEYEKYAPSITSITITPSLATVVAGKTQTFTATDQNGNGITTKVTWSSTDESVGTIDQNGVFTALKAGTTTMKAASGGVEGSASVTVLKPGHITAISISPQNPEYRKNYTINLTLSNPNSVAQSYNLGLKNNETTTCTPNLISHTVSAGGTGKYSFECNTNWSWIPEKEAGWSGLAEAFITTPLSALSPYHTELTGLEFYGMKKTEKYYITLGSRSTPDVQFADDSARLVEVRVPLVKEGWLIASLAGYEISSALTANGIKLLTVGDIPHGAGFLAGEAVGIIASWLMYQQAYDPDFNYHTVQEPISIYLPELDAVPEGDVKEFALTYADVISLRNATFTAYIRYDGARIDNQPDYMLIQLEAANNFTLQAMQKMSEVEKYYKLSTSSMEPLTDGQIQKVREEIQTNGLPQIEVDILTRNGLGGSIKNITQMILYTNPEVYRNPKNYTKYLDMYSGVLANESTEYTSEIVKIKVEDKGYSITTASDADIAYLENLKSQIQLGIDQKRATPNLKAQINEMISKSLKVLEETNNLTYSPYYEFAINALAIFQTLDTTPPTTPLTLSGTLGNNGWYISEIQVNLTAIDNESGVNKTEYSFDNTNWSTYTAPFNITNEGTTTLYYYSTDNAGNVESTKTQTINIDKNPPQITIKVPANGDEYILNQPVIADWSADDSVSGLASATGTNPSGEAVDTATVGTITFKVDAADNAGNPVTEIATYHVGYAYSGILQPINADGSSIFKLGNTVPVKFQLTDSGGNPVTDAVARIYVAKISDGILGTEMEANSTSAATTGNLFRYDSIADQYIFNLGTKSLSTGTWQIRIELDDGTSKYVNVGLK